MFIGDLGKIKYKNRRISFFKFYHLFIEKIYLQIEKPTDYYELFINDNQ